MRFFHHRGALKEIKNQAAAAVAHMNGFNPNGVDDEYSNFECEQTHMRACERVDYGIIKNGY
jgi:hypothetical protein